jgi:hypothetical protein
VSTFTIGKYTVREQLRFDNPAFPQYVVFLGDKLIGKSFSRPDLGCCQFLERESIYASKEQSVKPKKLALRGVAKTRRSALLELVDPETEPA